MSLAVSIFCFAIFCCLSIFSSASPPPPPPLHLHHKSSSSKKIWSIPNRAPASSSASTIPVLAPIRNDTVTLSGFDGGASFATQYHIAHSSQFRGIALLSTVPYLCAEGTLAGATNCLSNPWLINNAALYEEAAGLLATGAVDSFAHLKNQYVRIAASPADSLFNIGASQAAAAMYSTFLGAATVETDFSLDNANHAWVTSKYGNNCGALAAPYIADCPTSFAEVSMKKLFSHMGLVANSAAPNFNTSHLYPINQQKFGANPTENSLANHGYVYVPPQCVAGGSKAGRCHLHIHFHGCNQSSAVMFDSYALNTQLNEFALSNDVVVFYPQATINDEFLNPLGCFDFYGYEVDMLYELAYASKFGGQVKIIHGMQQALLNGFE